MWSMVRRGATLFVALGLAFTLAGPTPAIAADPIQPGDLMQAGNTQCTLNFVYTGSGRLAGNLYMGTNAHCVARVGQSVSDGRGRTWGRVAFIGNPNEVSRDFAFIQVLSSFRSLVRASVQGHPGTPRGVANASETGLGDRVLLSGYGLIYRPLELTREKRFGFLLSHSGSRYQAEAPTFFGDSGGPVVHARTGGALGIVAVICLGTCGLTSGPTVQNILRVASAQGFPVRLRSA
jgi:hypothetical protein